MLKYWSLRCCHQFQLEYALQSHGGILRKIQNFESTFAMVFILFCVIPDFNFHIYNNIIVKMIILLQSNSLERLSNPICK